MHREQAMSIAGITFNNTRFTHGVRGEGHERRQALRALAGALETGNLEAAGTAYQALKEAGPGRRFQGTSPAATDLATKFAAVGTALEAGDLAGAQGAFDALRGAIRDGGSPPPPEMSIQPVPNPGEVSTQPVGIPQVVYQVLAQLGFTVSAQGGLPGTAQPAATVPQIGAPATGGASATVPQIGAPTTGTTPAGSTGGTAPASGTPGGTPTTGSPAAGYSLSLSYLQVSWSYGGNSGSFTQTGLSLNVTG
jgi:hypothetical protein